uniref:Uncharacterized protein n=1 Tax=viral metagenome TaxID=1070528 RepID=A0A6C0LZI9_9ZZZZ
MATIIKLSYKKTTKPYSKYDEITEYHCWKLLEFLYDSKKLTWTNPITKKELNRNSDIIISFLSKCYYVWGDLDIIFNGEKLTYKKHIEKFIDKEYLFDIRKLKISSAIVANKPKSNSPAGSRIISNSPPKQATRPHNSPPAVKRISPRLQGSPGSPVSPGAATNKPKSNFPVVAMGMTMTRKPLSFNPTSIKNINKNSEKFTEPKCLEFVKYIKDKINNTKTSAEFRKLTFINPITKKPFGIDSPILQSFLTKCYYSFDNKEVKSIIEELINVSELMFDTSKGQSKPAIKAKPVISGNIVKDIDDYIDICLLYFYNCCDELIKNCDSKGILKSHHYIANVVNSIMMTLHVKYVHFNMYNNNTLIGNQPFQIYMYDEIFQNHLLSMGLDVKTTFMYNYNSKNIVYQQNDLQVSNIRTELNPKTIDTYYMCSLYNRQYVFEYPQLPRHSKKYTLTYTLKYNLVNTKFLPVKDFPESMNYARNTFDSTKKPYIPFNYKITNSVLPKYIFTNDNKEVSDKFTAIITLINDRLKILPVINGIANEDTYKNDYYENVIKEMDKRSFGNNETDYGTTDMIRKNILYSLNAKTPHFRRTKILYNEYYYNSEFTGTYPIFTWIPLNHTKINTIYNYPNAFLWQPLGINQYEQKEIDRFYKNNGIFPYSKDLNDIIYKIITDEYASIKSLIDPQKIEVMRLRVINTIGIYKSKSRKEDREYINNNIYLYHGTKNRLHSIGGKEKEIEILGFLSTTLNMYTASFYSGIGTNNIGLIYIIEVDYTQTYINLNDELRQVLLLPNSRLKVIYEFNFDNLCVILCRLFRTPSIDINNNLYNKLLDINNQTLADTNKYVSYRIKTNNNEMPICAFMLSKFWKTNKEYGYEDMDVYKIRRSKLNNRKINNTSLTTKNLQENFLYFSLGQEYELYVDRGLQLKLGSFEDIKYSIHQHFIKDCYKSIDIPCLEYIFIHSSFVNNAISTGILADDYINNQTNHYKYDINNFLIDCIFKFNSFKNENKKLNILSELGKLKDGIYVDKIEGFRDAGLYCHGLINPLFNIYADVGEHIQYIKNWQHLFTKYNIASDDDLTKHFKWCNNRIDKLIENIKIIKENYLIFINDKLIGKIKDTSSIDKKGILDRASKESLELNAMINSLVKILLHRCSFYKKCTNKEGVVPFIKIIRNILSEIHINYHNSKLYENPILEDLILYEEKQKSDSLLGGILSMNDINKLNTNNMSDTKDIKNTNDIKNTKDTKVIDHEKIYETFKNIPIQESKDMRKYKDMPKAFREYYKGATLDSDGYFDISDHCYCRFV